MEHKIDVQNPHTAEEKHTLLRKTKEGTITYHEALRLQEILEEERQEAQRKKDLQAFFVIALLQLSLARIMALLSKKS